MRLDGVWSVGLLVNVHLEVDTEGKLQGDGEVQKLCVRPVNRAQERSAFVSVSKEIASGGQREAGALATFH